MCMDDLSSKTVVQRLRSLSQGNLLDKGEVKLILENFIPKLMHFYNIPRQTLPYHAVFTVCSLLLVCFLKFTLICIKIINNLNARWI
jgi:hypothetical protein